MAISWYQITIERVEERPSRSQEWQKIADTGNDRDGGAVYAYAYYDSVARDRVKILEQNVGELDVVAVIKAINGI